MPLWLSDRQVRRYAEDEERMKRRLAALGWTCGTEEPNWWREEKGIVPSAERRHGQYLSARQAARALGVSPKTVKALRRRGRLRGFHTKWAPGRGNKWWFFRHDDVVALLSDRQYLDHHARPDAAAHGHSGDEKGTGLRRRTFAETR